MRRPTLCRVRRAATLVESAITLLLFLILILGVVDLAVGVLRFNTLSQAARHGSRQAMIHGRQAPAGWNGGPWGPSTIDVPANAQGVPIVEAVRPMLVNCDLDETRVVVDWPDGSNDLGKRVRVTVTSSYRPIVTFVFGNPTITLRGVSTMPIAH